VNMVPIAPTSPVPLVVVPYQAQRVRIVVVGAGGTGSWVVQHLARLVWDFNRSWAQVHDEEPRRAQLVIVDHDVVEEGNVRARQNFCLAEVGYPKAKVLALRYAQAFGLAEEDISAVCQPMASAGIAPRWGDLTILVGCVDNDAARRDIARMLDYPGLPYEFSRVPEAERPRPTWWIDSGNALHSGQALCGNVGSIEDLQGALAGPFCSRLPSPGLLHPELILSPPADANAPADQRSCKELVLAGEAARAQSRTINNHMAALVYGYVERLLYGGLTTFATYTDESSFTTRSLETTPEALALALGRPAAFFTHLPAHGSPS